MEQVFKQFSLFKRGHNRAINKNRRAGFGQENSNNRSNLTNAIINQEYTVIKVDTNHEEIKDFLFTLGCYEGEKITILSILADQFIVVVKDARYSIDRDLASCIIV